MNLLIAIFFLFNSPYTLQGVAIKIADGDTFTLLTPEKKSFRIRLNAIDAPEKGQDYYQRAKEQLGSLLKNQTLRVVVLGTDRYGRLIANIHLPDNRSVNLLMIETGLAWHFKKYSTDSILSKAEIEARKSKQGLWQIPAPVAPWQFRQSKKTEQLRRKNSQINVRKKEKPVLPQSVFS